jgi:hypothetical protein
MKSKFSALLVDNELLFDMPVPCKNPKIVAINERPENTKARTNQDSCYDTTLVQGGFDKA